MSGAFTSAGTKLYTAATLPTTYTKAGFDAVNWIEIGEITNIGEFGRSYNVVTHNPLSDRKTIKRKGSYNDGDPVFDMARVPSDAGQTILVAARDSDNSYPFKIVLQTGALIYFSAQVMSYTTNIGSVDQITAASVTVGIDNDIIEG